MKEALRFIRGGSWTKRAWGAGKMSHCTKYVGDAPALTNQSGRNRSPPLSAMPDLKYPFVGGWWTC